MVQDDVFREEMASCGLSKNTRDARIDHFSTKNRISIKNNVRLGCLFICGGIDLTLLKTIKTATEFELSYILTSKPLANRI